MIAGARRQIVEEHGRVGRGVGDPAEVLDERLLRHGEVVRRDRGDRRHTDRGRMLGQLDRLARGDRAHVGDHRHATGRRIHDDLGDDLTLGLGQQRPLAGRAARHQPVHALLDEPFDVRLQRSLVNLLAIPAQRRQQRHDHATHFKRFLHSWIPALLLL